MSQKRASAGNVTARNGEYNWHISRYLLCAGNFTIVPAVISSETLQLFVAAAQEGMKSSTLHSILSKNPSPLRYTGRV